ncbi:TetR/AcrR family transcriptional regulator [Arthrobacter sp. AL08]|uniref:TetR/AcrR family transcriptional regulator n=1 Tax=Micrococcaceae TaxID=1268 RepID=UPI00249C1DD4|nr:MULTISPECIES: TetR/AcrR family transcriptional regulator [Micrococcaceae]MDI3242285.1 TetR/AcrR family transcriptional regulator [Arthrobacter sp. AL05]MDI3278295.1 TetR/AcrR family transcriptional regulator [Arthrobacter sp. AL08]MDJ0351563.1 TetR/AcrR family transcriptional regulator [Pseudarthrobacter sp. PH31-O2]
MVQRGRRTARVSGDERQDAILAAAEALLGERGFDDISIEDLARGAGISRPTFYFYYSSKDEVLLALLDRVITEVEHRVGDLPRDFESDPAAAWTRSIGMFVAVFASHRGVATAAITARSRNDEVRKLWSKSMQSWADFSTDVITSEQARGAAPRGIDAHDLAVSLNLMNERVITAVLNQESPAIAESRALDVLSTIWIRSIYGSVNPGRP